MANIKVVSEFPLFDGMAITFNAPCECSAVDGLTVSYQDVSQSFTFRDAHGNNLAGLGNLFSEGALVKVILDTNNNAAFIQNADTNSYLESTFAKKAEIGDYVVAEGTSGAWTYRKWASGLAECWGTENLSCIHPNYTMFAFPFDFVEEPNVNLSCPSLGTAVFVGNVQGWSKQEFSANFDYYEVAIMLLMPDSYGDSVSTQIHQETGSVDFNVHIIGKWK